VKQSDKFKKYLFFIIFIPILLFILSINSHVRADNSLDGTYNVNFPAGTMFKGILPHNLSTAYNNVNDKVELIIPVDIQIGDVICIPKDSKLIGSIIRLGRAQQGKNGFFEIVFNSLKLPDNQELNILAHVWTKDGTGVFGGEFTDRVGYKKVPHSILGIGSVVQLIPDGPRKMGKDTEILTGSEWILVLDKELKINIIKDY